QRLVFWCPKSDLKTARGVSPSWVRIPPLPPRGPELFAPPLDSGQLNARGQGRERRARVEGMIRRLRLASGLVMFAYVTTHFVNHSLGLVSVQVMDRALEHIYQYWAS